MAGLSIGLIIILLATFASCKQNVHPGDNDFSTRQKRYARSPLCSDRFAAIPGSTMCIAMPRNSHALDTATKSYIVGEHNQIRANVVPAAADMLEVKYVRALEMEAQIWAEQCTFDHDDVYRRFQPDRYFIGQNMAVLKSTHVNWTDVINLWKAEKSHFTFGSTNDIDVVGNYTQMIWATTTAMGCGVAQCGDNHFYICNYGPMMNLSNIDTPYVKSASGNSCDMCLSNCTTEPGLNNALCDCSGVVCLNGATVNLTTCKCDCIQEVKAYDENDYCRLACVNGHDNPQCGTGLYTKSSCRSRPDTVFNCPRMCDICPYGGKDYVDLSVPLPWETKTPDHCTMNDHCKAALKAVCEHNVCKCLPAFKRTGDTCTSKGIGDPCDNSTDCNAIANSTCENTVCTCKSEWKSVLGTCVPKGIGDPCSSSADCVAAARTSCENNVCTCKSQWKYDAGMCVPKGLNDACTSSVDCAFVSNSICQGDTCVCDIKYKTNASLCIPKVLGGPCSSNATCAGAKGHCVSNTCTCPGGFIDKEDVCTVVPSKEEKSSVNIAVITISAVFAFVAMIEMMPINIALIAIAAGFAFIIIIAMLIVIIVSCYGYKRIVDKKKVAASNEHRKRPSVVNEQPNEEYGPNKRWTTSMYHRNCVYQDYTKDPYYI